MPSPPNWLPELANRVVSLIEPAGLLAPVGCHFGFAEGQWEVTLFISRTEIVGGEHDGRALPCPFIFDLLRLQQLFLSVRAMTWQSHTCGGDDELGAHIALEAVDHEQRPILLRVLANSPARFETGRYARIYEMRFEESW